MKYDCFPLTMSLRQNQDGRFIAMKIFPVCGVLCFQRHELFVQPRFDAIRSQLVIPVPFKTSGRYFSGWNFAPSKQIYKLFATQSAIDDETTAPKNNDTADVVRIGIVGGGIAAVSVAHALATKYRNEAPPFRITVLEGDSPRTPNIVPRNLGEQPWVAATARNGNSIVPGASMHVFSRPSVISEILKDTVREWIELQKDKMKKIMGTFVTLTNDEMFDEPPPYFAMHLWKCIGPSASSPERWSFVTFFKNFIHCTLSGGANERGEKLCQIAKANRAIYINTMESIMKKSNEKNKFGHSKGFLALYRSEHAAEESLKKTHKHGEPATKIESWQEIEKLEPHLANFPMASERFYGIRRPMDFIANCEQFVHHWIDESRMTGIVEYKPWSKAIQVKVRQKRNSPRAKSFQVCTECNSVEDFDLLVLAAGPETPLLARQLGIQQYCPTYPLRGFSLTIFSDENLQQGKTDSNLLRQPFSIDGMYCSSTTQNSARIVGFGEFVGYRADASDVPSIGPATLSRYAKKLFPGATHAEIEDVIPCFRPLSPDDLPLAGEVPKYDGLFLHTGHGTLGWTCALATGDVLCQAIVDRMHGRETQDGTYTLADGTTIDRASLSPKRFT